MSNSSYQIVAALTGDMAIASATNLTYSEQPQDIYSILLDKLKDKLQTKLNNELTTNSSVKASHIRAILASNKLTRAVFKKVLMTLPYGITPYGIKKHLKAHDIPYVNTLYEVLGEAIESDIKAFTTVQTYLRTIVTIIYGIDATIEWVNKSSFKLKPLYHETTDVRVKIGSMRLKYRVVQDAVDLTRTLSTITANVAHSLDATILHLTVQNSCVVPLNTVHDSYQTTVSNCETVVALVKTSFADVFNKQEILHTIRNEACVILKKHGHDPEQPIKLRIGKEDLVFLLPPVPKLGD